MRMLELQRLYECLPRPQEWNLLGSHYQAIKRAKRVMMTRIHCKVSLCWYNLKIMAVIRTAKIKVKTLKVFLLGHHQESTLSKKKKM